MRPQHSRAVSESGDGLTDEERWVGRRHSNWSTGSSKEVLGKYSLSCYGGRSNSHLVTAPVSNPSPDPDNALGKPSCPIASETLRAMVFTLPRPGADEPATVWQEVVQGGLDKLATLDPRDPMEATLAILVIAANAGALDAYRIAFEPGTTAVQALRQRANAAALTRGMFTAMRLLARLRARPAVRARDLGCVVAELAGVWQPEPARRAEARKGARSAEAQPETIIRWLDEVPDDELAEEVERQRKDAAGEPPLPVKPGPRRVYQHKPGAAGRCGKLDPQDPLPHPGWEKMARPERRAFFVHTNGGPVESGGANDRPPLALRVGPPDQALEGRLLA
jgi:hypothetical protein